MNKESKKFWKKVFILFGNDLQSWWLFEDPDNVLVREYVDNTNISTENEFPEYFDLTDEYNRKFTQKFLDEVMTW